MWTLATHGFLVGINIYRKEKRKKENKKSIRLQIGFYFYFYFYKFLFYFKCFFWGDGFRVMEGYSGVFGFSPSFVS